MSIDLANFALTLDGIGGTNYLPKHVKYISGVLRIYDFLWLSPSKSGSTTAARISFFFGIVL